jgi:NDP-sugar pyrophosphorylase family protein
MSAPLYPVIILAGGLATRLGEISRAVPKALIDVNGEPFVIHQLRLLKDRGIDQALLCVGYLGEQIVERVGNGRTLGLSVQYSFDGPRLLGTGGAIKRALPKLEGPAFFVLYGDAYLECDYAAVQTAFEASGKMSLMTVFRNEGRWGASNVEFLPLTLPLSPGGRGQGEGAGRILAYDKKKPTEAMCHIDFGVGVYRKEAFASTPANEPYDLATLQQDLLRADQLAGYEVFQRFYEIGSPAGLEETRQYLAKSEIRATDETRIKH